MKKILTVILIFSMLLATACSVPNVSNGAAEDEYINVYRILERDDGCYEMNYNDNISVVYPLRVVDSENKYLVEVCFDSDIGIDSMMDQVTGCMKVSTYDSYLKQCEQKMILNTNTERSCCLYMTQDEYEILVDWANDADYVDSVTKLIDLKSTSFYKKNGYIISGDGTAGVLTKDSEGDADRKNGKYLNANLTVCCGDALHTRVAANYQLLVVNSKNEYLVEVSFQAAIGRQAMMECICEGLNTIEESDFTDDWIRKDVIGAYLDSVIYLYVNQSEYNKLTKWAGEVNYVRSVFKLAEFEDTYYYNKTGAIPKLFSGKSMKSVWDNCRPIE